MRSLTLLFGLTVPVALFAFSCVSGDNTVGQDSGLDVTTNDVNGPDADSSVPTGATLTLGGSFVWVSQSGQAQLAFTIARNGVIGALTVHPTGLPTGVTAADATIADGQSSGTLTFAASSSTVLGATASANIQLLDQSQQEDQKSLTVGVSGKPGDLDTTWGTGGALALPLTSPTTGYAIDVYPATAGANAGKIVVAGNEVISNTDVRLIIARYNPSGTLDTTFGDAGGDGGARLGYVVYNPGGSDQATFATYPPSVRIDSKGRIALLNRRSAGTCAVEVGRWTAVGDVDTSFTRYSANLNGGFCGTPVDLRIASNDDVVVLAAWNIQVGEETIVQVFSNVDGARQGSGFHLSLDATGTSGNQKSTEMHAFAIDKNGGYVLAGRQCDGSWSTPYTACTPVIARLTPNGQRDSAFGSNAGYTGFSYGSGLSQIFYGVTIDPTNADIIAVGVNDTGALAALARASGTSGLPTSFGSQGKLTRDLLSGATTESLDSVMVDHGERIVAVGGAGKSAQSYVARTRSAPDGTLDGNYGTGGVATTIGAMEQGALGNDDRLYVVGYAGGNLVTWRFWP